VVLLGEQEKMARRRKLALYRETIPHDRLESRGFLYRQESCDPFPATFLLPLPTILRHPVSVLEGMDNLSDPIELQNQSPQWDHAASRWPARSPDKRMRREDQARSHRPQISSDLLFQIGLLTHIARLSASPGERRLHALRRWSSERGHLHFASTIHNRSLTGGLACGRIVLRGGAVW
jgi:hypothetical protein